MEDLQFGKYKVTRGEKLGEGASGSVYYGVHPNLDIPIAIKALTPSFSNDESYIERFINEAKMAAKIKHENAVMIYDADCHDGTYYIVMEYVSGGDIKEKMKELGQMQEKEALSITRSIASALHAASKFNIIHRDIKPSNIMLGEGDVPKLADLGIAKLKSDESDNTVTGTIIGTPNYLAPEQAADSKGVDARADIYSLGCTCYAMLAGDAPYKAESPLGVLMKHAEAPIPDITSANPNVSKLTAKLIKKMMAKDPANRPQSAEEVMKEIDRISLNFDIPEKRISKQKKNYLLAILFTIFIISSLAYAFLPKDESNNKQISSSNISTPTSPKSGESQTLKVKPPEITPTTPSIGKGFVIPSLEIEMLKVTAGSFQMGAQIDDPKSQADETLHRVTITEDFFLSKYEVSVKAWKEFVNEMNYKTSAEKDGGAAHYKDSNWIRFTKGRNWKSIDLQNDDAISTISYTDCLEFCKWLNNRELNAKRLMPGWGYTLPTEAQWEYSCRAGSYSSYANELKLNDCAFFDKNSQFKVHKPGLKKSNEWGFHDMHGNVWEFCIDKSAGNTFFDVKTESYIDGIIDPKSNKGHKVIFRGGSFADNADLCRSASRGHSLPGYSSNNHGFRLCLTKSTP